MFVNTSVLGLKIPGHVNFEEVNLRFYVKYKHEDEWRRGVVFIKEIVPRSAITFVANTLYKENYETLSMSHSWQEVNDELNIKYSWEKNNALNSIEIKSKSKAEPISEGSDVEFITEHYWGYAKVNNFKTNQYEVTHPQWEHYPVLSFDVKIDFMANYGQAFKCLQDVQPSSVMLAEGSLITVENKTVIK
jgi:uncharacterized protein YqjF (DUF2071 family)